MSLSTIRQRDVPELIAMLSKRMERLESLVSLNKQAQVFVGQAGQNVDFTDLQPAITYLNAKGGGTIYIRRGTYTATADITMHSNIHLIGEDSENTIIDFNQTSYKISAVGKTNFSFENLQFKNGRSTTGILFFQSCSKLFISECVFTDNSNAAGDHVDIYFDTGNNNRIRISNNNSTNSGTFVYLKSVTGRTTISNNNITTPIGHVFVGDASGGGRGLFLDNFITDATKSVYYGKFVYTHITANRTSFNSQVSTEYQVDLSDSSNLTITGCHFSQGGDGGIKLTDSTTAEITGNNIAANGSGKHAIALVNTGGITIVGNFLLAGAFSNANGVNLDADSDSNAVVGNRIIYNTTAVSDAGTANVVASNS